MKIETIAIGLLAVGATTGAAITVFPSDFTGVFGAQQADFIDPQPVNLDAALIRKTLSNTTVHSIFHAYAEAHGREMDGFGYGGFAQNEVNRLSSSTEVIDDTTVQVSISFDGEKVINIIAHIEPVSSTRSTLDIEARFNYDWLSDTGKVIPGDLARIEPIVEVLATEYALSTLQRRPFASSDDDIAQIYGQKVIDAIEKRLGKGRGRHAQKRLEAAFEAKLHGAVEDFMNPASPHWDPEKVRKYVEETERKMTGSRSRSQVAWDDYETNDGWQSDDPDDLGWGK